MIDLAVAIRTSILASSGIVALLPTYLGAKAVFTRRPVPDDAAYPFILVSPDISVTDDDMVSQQVPIILRDITVFGQNDQAEKYRAVESIAYLVRDLFHRQPSSLAPTGWNVIDVVATGPFPGPTDDDNSVARVVSLTVRLTPAS